MQDLYDAYEANRKSGGYEHTWIVDLHGPPPHHGSESSNPGPLAVYVRLLRDYNVRNKYGLKLMTCDAELYRLLNCSGCSTTKSRQVYFLRRQEKAMGLEAGQLPSIELLQAQINMDTVCEMPLPKFLDSKVIKYHRADTPISRLLLEHFSLPKLQSAYMKQKRGRAKQNADDQAMKIKRMIHREHSALAGIRHEDSLSSFANGLKYAGCDPGVKQIVTVAFTDGESISLSQNDYNECNGSKSAQARGSAATHHPFIQGTMSTFHLRCWGNEVPSSKAWADGQDQERIE